MRELNYNRAGLISSSSLPYFKALETPKWLTTSYDSLNRVSQIVNPDGSSFQYCYSGSTGASIDPNGHWRTVATDGNGRFTDIREFASSASKCDTNLFTTLEIPYSHVQYSYDGLARLIAIKDSNGNTTSARWNSLESFLARMILIAVLACSCMT